MFFNKKSVIYDTTFVIRVVNESKYLLISSEFVEVQT